MIRNFSFSKGGIYLNNRKGPLRDRPIWNAALPSSCIVPLLQNSEYPAEALVSVGDFVREGMLIAAGKKQPSAKVHAPIPGKVREIREMFLPDGRKSPAVVIDLEGEFDRLGKEQTRYDWRDQSKRSLLKQISDMGVVGMGGNAYPSHSKLEQARTTSVRHFVVNAAESEPYFSADHRLFLANMDDILDGIEIIRKIVEPEQVIIALEKHKRILQKKLQERITDRGLKSDVAILREKYPQGAEPQLVKALFGSEVPPDVPSLEEGVMMLNLATVHAIFEAIVLNKPLIERSITVAGGALRSPANLKVRIGTPIQLLFEECEGFIRRPQKIVLGGPMKGYVVYDPQTPVVKSTRAVLALSKREVNNAPETSCIQCGRCVRACPMGLQPTFLYKWIEHHDYDTAEANGLFDCIECGCCAYACVARLPLVGGFRMAKDSILNRRKRA